jgi:hypothetical protein
MGHEGKDGPDARGAGTAIWLRLALWLTVGAELAVFAASATLEKAPRAERPEWLGWLPFVVVALQFLVAAPLAGVLGRRLNRQAPDWVVATLLLPVAPPLLLSLLPRRARPAEDVPTWRVALLGIGCLFALIGLVLASDAATRPGGIRMLGVAVALLVTCGLFDLHQRGRLLRGVLALLAALWIGFAVSIARSLLHSTRHVIGDLTLLAVYTGILAALAAHDATQRGLPGWRWAMGTLLAPFATPVVLALTPSPWPPELVNDFRSSFEGFLEAETRRLSAEGRRIDSLRVAQVCIENAKTFVIAKHHLDPSQAESLAAQFARSWRP